MAARKTRHGNRPGGPRNAGESQCARALSGHDGAELPPEHDPEEPESEEWFATLYGFVDEDELGAELPDEPPPDWPD